MCGGGSKTELSILNFELKKILETLQNTHVQVTNRQNETYAYFLINFIKSPSLNVCYSISFSLTKIWPKQSCCFLCPHYSGLMTIQRSQKKLIFMILKTYDAK